MANANTAEKWLKTLIKVNWTRWDKGTPFIWGRRRFNGGNIYICYRFGPLLIRMFVD